MRIAFAQGKANEKPEKLVIYSRVFPGTGKLSAVYLTNIKGKNKYKKEQLVTWGTYSIGYKFESLDTVYANYFFFIVGIMECGS